MASSVYPLPPTGNIAKSTTLISSSCSSVNFSPILPITTPLTSPTVILYIVDFFTSLPASIWRQAGMPNKETSPTSYSPGPLKINRGVESTTANLSSVNASTSLPTGTFLPPATSTLGSNTTRSFFVVKTTAFAPLYSISNILTPFSIYLLYLSIPNACF